MKALPYGISDFPRVINEDYYYVDKTRYIELIENQPDYLFLIRPRPFGKSFFPPCWKRTIASTTPTVSSNCSADYI